MRSEKTKILAINFASVVRCQRQFSQRSVSIRAHYWIFHRVSLHRILLMFLSLTILVSFKWNLCGSRIICVIHVRRFDDVIFWWNCNLRSAFLRVQWLIKTCPSTSNVFCVIFVLNCSRTKTTKFPELNFAFRVLTILFFNVIDSMPHVPHISKVGVRVRVEKLRVFNRAFRERERDRERKGMEK